MGKKVYPGLRTQLFLVALISSAIFVEVNALYPGFYAYSCPNAEKIVLESLKSSLASDPTLGGPLLRMMYHDCFVRGCDASILLNSVNGNTAEKDAVGPNKDSLRGYEVIDAAKTELEKACPGVVSCADIIQFVARDVVVLDGGPSWEVPSGRRDGSVSTATEALANLVGPDSDYDTQKASFEGKGLSEKDLVVLTGAHTIGRSHCAVIQTRLYNFSGTGQTDPSLDKSFAKDLKRTCPFGSTGFLSLDGTEFEFDTKYFQRVQQHKGLFTSDASFLTQPFPASIVKFETKKENLYVDFPVSMVRMSSIEVLSSNQGEVRKNCAFVN